jgi:hypothetical protein
MKQAVKLLLILPLAVVILGALILAAQSACENRCFSNATQQIINLVSLAHDAAGRQADFAIQPGQDVLAALAHAEQIAAFNDNGTAKLLNPWQGALHGRVTAPSVLSIDMEVPARDCRRLALFFAGAAPDLNLVSMETAPDGVWTGFYKGTDTVLGAAAAEAACGQKASVRLALDFRLR